MPAGGLSISNGSISTMLGTEQKVIFMATFDPSSLGTPMATNVSETIAISGCRISRTRPSAKCSRSGRNGRSSILSINSSAVIRSHSRISCQQHSTAGSHPKPTIRYPPQRPIMFLMFGCGQDFPWKHAEFPDTPHQVRKLPEDGFAGCASMRPAVRGVSGSGGG